MVNIIPRIYIKIRFMSPNIKKISKKYLWKKSFDNYFKEEKAGCKINKKDILQNKMLILKGFTDKLDLIKSSQNNLQINKDKMIPIVISVVKNEVEKLPLFLSHYRKMGIKQFIFIDNVSSDGTVDYLKKQLDVEVFSVKTKFCSFLKEGWINQVLALHGFYRWYMVVDADELLVWPQFEKISLRKLISVFYTKRMYRPVAIMLDMYSKGLPYQCSSENLLDEFCYCDMDSYYWLHGQNVNILSGGPRERKMKIKVWLSKTPLFYLRPLDIFCCAHYMYPYQNYKNPKCPIVLLHYKFAYKSTHEQMKDYVKNGKDSIRIYESKTYLRKSFYTFFYEGSLKLNNLTKLSEIQYVEDIIKR